jgi:hypothetical protein
MGTSKKRVRKPQQQQEKKKNSILELGKQVKYIKRKSAQIMLSKVVSTMYQVLTEAPILDPDELVYNFDVMRHFLINELHSICDAGELEQIANLKQSYMVATKDQDGKIGYHGPKPDSILCKKAADETKTEPEETETEAVPGTGETESGESTEG